MSELRVYFFRHALTYGNVEAKMCGRTDTLVCKQGWDELYELKEKYEYPTVDRVYASPAIRCRETASVLFPGQSPKLVQNFWEMDFGTWEDLPVDCGSGEGFEKWLNQDPDCGFPEGESVLECRYRAVAGMTRVVKECREEGLTKVAVVAHGEVLSCLMDMALITNEPKSAFTLCPNGMGYEAVLDMDKWFWEAQKMEFVQFLPVGAPRMKPEDSPFFAKQDKGEIVEEDKKTAED